MRQSSRPITDTMLAAIFNRRFAGNYLSTLAFVGLAYWIITDASDFHRNALQGQWQGLRIHTLIVALIALYAVVLVPYYAAYPWMRSKSFVFLQGIGFSLLRWVRGASRAHGAQLANSPWRLPLKAGLSPAAKQAGLALLLKFFFAPLMLNWCLNHMADLAGTLIRFIDSVKEGVRGRDLFDGSFYWASFQLILFVDTLLFTIGYIVEVPALRNRIVTVEPTFFGWFVCLACYPPFNDVTSRFLPWQSTDFPQFTNTTVHFICCGMVLVSMAIYSWSSVALGFKASNLTNRGIVSRGPYSVVRHPAYAAKNFAWWIGALPTVAAVFARGDLTAVGWSLCSLVGWTTIYVLRAITEERHLLLTDNGYEDYARRVRYRFIPGVI